MFVIVLLKGLGHDEQVEVYGVFKDEDRAFKRGQELASADGEIDLMTVTEVVTEN